MEKCTTLYVWLYNIEKDYKGNKVLMWIIFKPYDYKIFFIPLICLWIFFLNEQNQLFFSAEVARPSLALCVGAWGLNRGGRLRKPASGGFHPLLRCPLGTPIPFPFLHPHLSKARSPAGTLVRPPRPGLKDCGYAGEGQVGLKRCWHVGREKASE